MKKHLIVIGTAVLLLVVGLSGCNEIGGNSELDRFVGKWKGGFSPLLFYKDRTCNIGSLTGNYRIEEGTLVVDLDIEKMSVLYEYEFSNNDNTLTLTELGLVEVPIVYTRQ